MPVEDEPYSDIGDLVELMDSLGIQRERVAGWSMGSGIAIDFAIAHPDRVKSLIPVGPWINGYSSPGAIEMFEGMGQVVTAMAEGGRTAAVDALMGATFMQKTMTDSAAAVRFRDVAADYSFWAFSHPSPQVPLSPGALERLSEIEAPTLVIVGELDVQACVEIADLLVASLTNAAKAVVPGTGHMMQLEKPAEVNDLISEFIGSVMNR